MKRTPIKRRTPLARTAGPGRKAPVKQSQPRRDWTDARAKVDREGTCRVCGAWLPPELLQAAHVAGREHDEPRDRHDSFFTCANGEYQGRCSTCSWRTTFLYDKAQVRRECLEHEERQLATLYVHPDRVVPLCQGCHRSYDPHTRGLDEKPVDLLPHLTEQERRRALEDCSWDVFAFLYRTTGVRWVPLDQTFGPESEAAA